MSLLQMGSKEKWEVIGIQGVARHCIVRHCVGWGDFVMCRPRFWRVLWTGVVRSAVHVLGGFLVER